MLDLRFRAWNARDKYMVTNSTSVSTIVRKHLMDYPQTGLTGDGGDYNGSLKRGDYLLSQYIGIKDKNDVDVFEGDIIEEGDLLECSRDDKQRLIILYDIHGSRYAGWSSFNHPTNTSAEKFIHDWEYTVIGNMYENPELLKQ